jgi:hypothetical protein
VVVIRASKELTLSSEKSVKAFEKLVETAVQLTHASREQAQLSQFVVDDVMRSHQAMRDSYDTIAPAMEMIAKAYSDVIAASSAMELACHRSVETCRDIVTVCKEVIFINQHTAEELIDSHKLLGNVQQEVMSRFEATANVAAAASHQAAVTCQQSVESVTGACEAAAQLAVKTCHEVIHSAFPARDLDWSWHHENSFTCYFCQRRFPMTEKETIGKYDYCIEHGTMRKERLLREECGVSQS